RATAPALSSTPQSSSVWKVRLSVATTDWGGTLMVWVPLLSSTWTVVAEASDSVWAAVSPPQAATPNRLVTATVASRLRRKAVDWVGLRPEVIMLLRSAHQGLLAQIPAVAVRASGTLPLYG